MSLPGFDLGGLLGGIGNGIGNLFSGVALEALAAEAGSKVRQSVHENGSMTARIAIRIRR